MISLLYRSLQLCPRITSRWCSSRNIAPPHHRSISTNDTLLRGRVLSIQSHVVSGYVGNKAVVFPLQLLGFDVDPLNTTQLSNHTGYPIHPGHRLDSHELETIIGGLRQNDLLSYTHLLTGFIGSPAVLRTMADI